MSFKEGVQSISLDAGADLSASQFLMGVVNANGEVIVAGAGVGAVGSILTNPVAGEAAEVGVYGVVKVKAGAAIAAGARVETNANGEVITAVAGIPVGIALKAAGAANEIIPVLLKSLTVI